MKHAIRVLNGFGESLEVILPKLRDGYIVPEPRGRGLALENPDAFFLSQSGECFHNVTVTGGKQRCRRAAVDETRAARRPAPAE